VSLAVRVRAAGLLPALVLSSFAGAALATDHPDTTVHPAIWPRVAPALRPDPALDARVRDLLARMPVEDKVGQLIQADISAISPDDLKTYRLGSVIAGGNSGPGGNDFASAAQWRDLVDRFHAAARAAAPGHVAVPLLFGIDAVHGHNNVPGATLFPQNSALGATRDPALIREIGAATADEVRATHIDWTFAPTLAVPQDDRWGRTYEGYSQDPKLVAAYARAMVEGLQGKAGTPGFLRGNHVVATAKHFLGDGGTFEGRDQGDTRVSETTLRDVHGAGYVTAIGAGVQTVMASFSSWNGVKMHGNHALLTDVLKHRMGFDGFVVGDWQAHGQLEGCSNDDCPKAINAGVDMLMAPDSWKGLYAHTLAEVKSGVIPMARLDDAVGRILRVKLRAGLFDHDPAVGAPDLSAIGSPAHRAIARRAVRESLVLLKNRGGVLPIDPHRHVLVAGDGADNVSKQSGGWTVTWQGTGVPASAMAGATSIYAGIASQVRAAGGTATLSPDGAFATRPDVAIVVFGEDPYAEFQGDLMNVAFHNGSTHDLELIRRLKSQGIPVVSVFLAGRPLWVNREINASDAFVMAWLPGSEGEGVADVLLRRPDGKVQYDFHGKLSYAWPRTAVQIAQAAGQVPQYPYGFGLTYADRDRAGPLPEASDLPPNQGVEGVYLQRGKPSPSMQLVLADAGHADGAVVTAVPARSPAGDVALVAIDHRAQEDARRVTFSGHGGEVALRAAHPVELRRQTNGDMMLVVELRPERVAADAGLALGVDCAGNAACRVRLPVAKALAALPADRWTTFGVPLKCLRDAGASMDALGTPFALDASGPAQLSVSRVALDDHADTVLACPAK
jgi:beta-glucosidase